MTIRKLVRSSSDKMIAGVCGGLANYLDIDPTLVRLVFVMMALTPLHGVLIYLILWLITPIDYKAQPIPVQPAVPPVPPVPSE